MDPQADDGLDTGKLSSTSRQPCFLHLLTQRMQHFSAGERGGRTWALRSRAPSQSWSRYGEPC